MVLALQLILVLACLFYGARKGGITLGLLGGIGLVILAFGFGLAPGKPPTDVMLTIVAVVAASATLQDAYAQLMHEQIWFPSPLASWWSLD
jgi:anaerobic C4-dicarboxylate transporter DcuB